MMYYLEANDNDGQGWYRHFNWADYLNEWRDYVRQMHYAALADIREFGMDTHCNYRAVSVDGKEIITLWNC